MHLAGFSVFRPQMAVSALLGQAQLCKETVLSVGGILDPLRTKQWKAGEVPGHFQSTAEVPLSKVPNGQEQLTLFYTSPL